MYYPLKNQQQPISYFFLTQNCQENNIAGTGLYIEVNKS